MVLAEVVSEVGMAWCPIYMEVSLVDSILEPVESHVNGLGSSLFDIGVCDSNCSGIIHLDWCGRLGSADFLECGSNGSSFFGIGKGSTHFGLGG